MLELKLNHASTRGPGQNKRHFADDIFECNFFDKNVFILIRISLDFFTMGPIENKSDMVQVMDWHRTVTIIT